MVVCVYCASSSDVSPAFSSAAARLGELLGSRRHAVVCGAGNQGLMRRLADSALAAGGEVTGVIPRFMADNGWGHDRLTRTVVTPDMHARKRAMAELAAAAIALPGGCGTLEELLEIVTWKQLGLFTGKIVIVNTEGYYDPLLAMLGKAVEERMMKPSHLRLWRVAATPDEAVAIIEDEKEEAAIDPKR